MLRKLESKEKDESKQINEYKYNYSGQSSVGKNYIYPEYYNTISGKIHRPIGINEKYFNDDQILKIIELVNDMIY